MGHWRHHPRRYCLAPFLILSLMLCSSCKRDRPPVEQGVLTVSVEQHASWIRNFNPLVAVGGARWPTQGGIYEPMLIFNSMAGDYVPWLATSFEWRDENKALYFSVRQGVLWSDGTPFSASDVVYTFNLMKAHPAMDGGGVWKHLDSVTESEDGALFQFKSPFFPALQSIAHQPIVPQHIWTKLDDPVSFANPEPVATGPFTEILSFKNQIYELGANPHYWNGPLEVTQLRFPAFPSNDQANLALVSGEVDWAGNFVPAIDRIYVDKAPQHHGYWFPLMGSTVFLYANTTKEPFNQTNFRKAMSLGLDRALMVKVGVYDYTKPADATGLSDTYSGWRSSEVVETQSWTRYDPAAANEMLDTLGYSRGADGIRVTKSGTPLTFDIIVVSGWSDWVRAAQIVASGLTEIGISAKVKTYDFGAWFNRLQEGSFDLAISWSAEGQTPYDFYRWLMSGELVKPIGEAAPGNWHRFGDADVDAVLRKFEVTTDRAEQMKLATALQESFAEQAPAIPLFPNPSWGVYNTSRFQGFPTESNPYAQLSPNKLPESLLVLKALKVRREGGSL